MLLGAAFNTTTTCDVVLLIIIIVVLWCFCLFFNVNIAEV